MLALGQTAPAAWVRSSVLELGVDARSVFRGAAGQRGIKLRWRSFFSDREASELMLALGQTAPASSMPSSVLELSARRREEMRSANGGVPRKGQLRTRSEYPHLPSVRRILRR